MNGLEPETTRLVEAPASRPSFAFQPGFDSNPLPPCSKHEWHNAGFDPTGAGFVLSCRRCGQAIRPTVHHEQREG